MELEVTELQIVIDKIIREYRHFLQGGIASEKTRTAIGLQISTLKKYEIDQGSYQTRSITVIPNSSRIIDLSLAYNTKDGPIKYELNIKPRSDGKYTIIRNIVSNYNENEPLNVDNKIMVGTLVSTPLVQKRKKRSPISESKSKSTRTFLCHTKDTNCCYTKKNHNKEKCSVCCYDEPHTEI